MSVTITSLLSGSARTPAVAQVPVGTFRLVGAAVVVLLAIGILYITFRVGDTPDYDDHTDDDDGVLSRGPAYGLSSLSHGLDSTADVSEVLQVEDGTEQRDAGGSGADAGVSETEKAGDAPPDRSGGSFAHEFRGDRARGLLYEVTDGDRSVRFFVEDRIGDPSVTPASPADRRHDQDWLDEARDYLRERALEEALSEDHRETERE